MKLVYDVIEGDFDRAGEASAQIKKSLQLVGIAPDIIRRIAIGTYEGEINMIIHATGGQIRAEIQGNSTTIELEDNGPGIPDVDKALQEGYSTASDDVRAMGFGAGMGLPNMVKCSDDFQIESRVGEGTKIVMKFDY